MNKSEYIKILNDFSKTFEIDDTIIREYCKDNNVSFNINEFMQVLNIVNSPFVSLQYPELQKYSGIDYQQVMLDVCFKHFDSKFNITRCELDFTNVLDKKITKNLFNKYSSGKFTIIE